MTFTELLSLGYKTKVTPGDGGLDPGDKPYTYHVEILTPDDKHHWGEYSHSVDETIAEWHEDEWGDW